MSEISEILEKIRVEDELLQSLYSDKLQVNDKLDRTLVSFQANKAKNGNRWCKYKEGFSYDLIYYILHSLDIKDGCVFDPFAGSGTTLFVASDLGIKSVGIELLPNSVKIIEARRLLRGKDKARIIDGLRDFRDRMSWAKPGESKKFTHIRITKGAFLPETEAELERYLYETEKINDTALKEVLYFVVMCVLEDISYTRKDGQYLRWDYRSGRTWGKKQFNKGNILSFTPAIRAKLNDIINDISQEQLRLDDFNSKTRLGEIELIAGSCLDALPNMQSQSFNCLITSPPYCNRYDYTRTYALELAMLGINEEEIRSLRQTMLSCTVENKEKRELGAKLDKNRFQQAIEAFESQRLLYFIRTYLNKCKEEGLLNNNGIPSMVHNYFKELAVVIFECARLLKPGSPFVMVNDNVRYQGVQIPVDLILSDIARKAGFSIETIWVLPIGKGNSSQQMRLYGRKELRKCVYVWRR